MVEEDEEDEEEEEDEGGYVDEDKGAEMSGCEEDCEVAEPRVGSCSECIPSKRRVSGAVLKVAPAALEAVTWARVARDLRAGIAGGDVSGGGKTASGRANARRKCWKLAA